MTDKKSTAVAPTKENTALPAELMEDIYADQGAGAEDASGDDMTIPFVKVAQALSDEVNKRESAYVDGLEQGDFFNSATQEAWKGEDGFLFVPAMYQRKYLEWVPRSAGGGFAGEHDASILNETRKDGNADVLANGNEIVTTATWYGLIVDPSTGETQQAVVALSKSQLKKSKQLMTKLKSVSLKRPDGKGTFNPPTFYHVVRVTSVPESNDQGSWFGWSMKLEGTVADLPNGGDVYAQAKAMHEAVRSGVVKTAAPDAPTTASTDVDDDVPF